MTTMKAGTIVRLKQPTITGPVIERKFDAADNLVLLVEYTDADGELHQRWFKSDDMEAVEQPATVGDGSAK